MSIIHIIHTTSRAILKMMHRQCREAGYHLNREQWMILFVCLHNPGASQQDIAEWTEKDKASITRIIASLEQQNLVMRKSHPKDGRIRTVHPTTQALNMKRKIQNFNKKMLQVLLQDSTEQELQTTTTFLNRIYTNTNEHIKP